MATGKAVNGGALRQLDFQGDMKFEPGKAQISQDIPGVLAFVSPEIVLVRAVERMSDPQRGSTLAIVVCCGRLTGNNVEVQLLHGVVG